MVEKSLTAGALLVILSLPCATFGQQEAQMAKTIEFRFTPTGRTQIALWIEDGTGVFLQTVRLTQAVSYRGIGNRPGAAQMNSGFLWPYGRREGVLPIWAYRRASAPGAKQFRRVIFQNRDSEGFASRTSNDSSPEYYFCLSFNQALTPELRRQQALDTVTCASRFTSDKGRFLQQSENSYAEPAVVDGQGIMRILDYTSLYPPRRDVQPCATPDCSADTLDAPKFDAHVHDVMPDIDTVSMATPPADLEQSVLFTIPDGWPAGQYIAWLEVNVEGDYNEVFNDKTFPTPTTPDGKWDSWAISSGYPYRGQPSVIFQIPFTPGSGKIYSVVDPSFYGDVDGFGATGQVLHPMDGKITNDAVGHPGKGADRIRLVSKNNYRVQLTSSASDQCGSHQAPDRPDRTKAAPVADAAHSHQWGELRFTAPNSQLAISNYEVRFSTAPIIEGDSSTFDSALPAVAASIDSQGLRIPTGGLPGTEISADFGGMQPLTRYFVAVRAVDTCNTPGPFSVAQLTTTKINFTKLSGCFVATAAYGSDMEPRVASLRRARDALRKRSTLFSVATDVYYRSGPAAADVISRSDLVRAVFRQLLTPVVEVAQVAFPLSTAPAVRQAPAFSR